MHIELPPPVLDAGPVRLLRIGAADAALERALSCCEDVVAWTFYPPRLTEEQASRRIRRAQESAAVGESARYVLEVQGDAVGTVGIKNTADAPEIFYALLPSGRGRGTATSAVLALACWALSAGAPYAALWTQAGNRASERVAERAGFFCADPLADDTAQPDFPGPRLWTRFPD